ncbi:hypothetical protein BGZ76_007127, partial [Entomortierella beljakovae]
MDSSTTTPNPLKLTFVIDGRLVSNNFEESVSKDTKINELKELLRTRRPGLFGDIPDASLLRLWRVSIPLEEDILVSEEKIKEKVSMISGDISKYFDEDPIPDQIHVIVKRPE